MSKFAQYGWFNKRRSSEIELLPTSWIIKKIKPNRSELKQREEFFAIHIWSKLLDFYTKQYRWVSILSPEPIGISLPENSITMSMVPGDELDHVISGSPWINGYFSTLENPKIAHREFKNTTVHRLGQLLKIKDIEWLVHWDFLMRHVFSHKNHLWVIDVENSTNMTSDAVVSEKTHLVDLIMNCCANSPNFQKVTKEHIMLWYESITDARPIIKDFILETEKSLWFQSTRFKT